MKILVVDDHALVRAGLCQVLKGLDEQVEVFEASHCARAFELCALHPDLDLVLLDYQLPDINGLEGLGYLRKNHPSLPVVMLSGSASQTVIQQVLASGAVGFVTKTAKSTELLEALRAVLAGNIYVPPEFAAQTDRVTPGEGPKFVPLTPRQVEVLYLLLDGRSNKEISRLLDLSDETVKNHVTAILRSFNVQTRIQAVLAAQTRGYARARPRQPL